jgi:hypothetical protein
MRLFTGIFFAFKSSKSASDGINIPVLPNKDFILGESIKIGTIFDNKS